MGASINILTIKENFLMRNQKEVERQVDVLKVMHFVYGDDGGYMLGQLKMVIWVTDPTCTHSEAYSRSRSMMRQWEVERELKEQQSGS